MLVLALSTFFFEYFRSQTGDPATVYGWVRGEANLLQGYVYGVRCAAESDPDCCELRAGAAEMGNPISKSQPYRTVWLYQLND